MSFFYLVPSPISQANLETTFPSENVNIYQKIDVWIVEKLKTARRFLRKADANYPIDDKLFIELDKYKSEISSLKSELIRCFAEQKNIGLMSEAGYPSVADPGEEICLLAHQLGFKIVPLIGPSSIMLGLVASGLPAERFMYQGYFPLKEKEFNQKQKEVLHFLDMDITQIFIETPYRSNSFAHKLTQIFALDTYLCVATDISGEGEFIRTQTLGAWKNSLEKHPLPKSPTIFILSKNNQS